MALPPESAFIRTEAPHTEWRITEELLAVLIEVVDLGNRMFHAANTKKGTPQPQPIRLPRPGREDRQTPKRRVATSDEMRRFFAGAVSYTPRSE